MTIIREYLEQDAAEVGLLIKNTYSEFNLDFLSQKDQGPFWGPFFYTESIPGYLIKKDIVLYERNDH